MKWITRPAGVRVNAIR